MSDWNKPMYILQFLTLLVTIPSASITFQNQRITLDDI